LYIGIFNCDLIL